MSLLSKAIHGIHLDKRSVGNLIKNLAPALAFTPVGALGAGIAAGVGGLARGENLKTAALSGVKNAAIGGGLKAGAGALRGALNGGAASGGGVSVPAAPGGIPIPASANFTGTQIPSGTGLVGGGGPGILSKSLGFIKENPSASAMGLNAIGGLATSGAQNRAANAQAGLLEQEQDQNAYDLLRRKKRDEELDPLYGGLGTALGQSLSRPIAPNPYAAGA